jgi:hypothetical protein
MLLPRRKAASCRAAEYTKKFAVPYPSAPASSNGWTIALSKRGHVRDGSKSARPATALMSPLAKCRHGHRAARARHVHAARAPWLIELRRPHPPETPGFAGQVHPGEASPITTYLSGTAAHQRPSVGLPRPLCASGLAIAVWAGGCERQVSCAGQLRVIQATRAPLGGLTRGVSSRQQRRSGRINRWQGAGTEMRPGAT